MQPSRISKLPRRCIDLTNNAIPLLRTSPSASSPFCHERFGIAAILISPRELPIARSHLAGNWEHAHTLAPSLYHAGMAAVFARDVASASDYGHDCVALASQHGFGYWVAFGRILQGWADAQRGEAKTGIALVRDGVAAAEATGTRLCAPLVLTLLASALALTGRMEEALAILDDALAKAAATGERGWGAEIHRLRGELAGRLPYPYPAKAEDAFRIALAIAREQGTRNRSRAGHARIRIARCHGPRPAVGRAGPAG